METQNTFDPQDFTKLPASMHMKPNSVGGLVRVLTPHKGEVLLDWQYDGCLDVYETRATKMVTDIWQLESEAKSYLFDNWVAQQKKI